MDLQSLLNQIGSGTPVYISAHVNQSEDFDKLKLIGNDCFKKKNYELAVKAYQKAASVARNDI